MVKETKFDMWQEVWVMNDDKPTKAYISEINCIKTHPYLEDNVIEIEKYKVANTSKIRINRTFTIDEIFLSKEDLINSL